MGIILLLLFVLVPVAEIALLLQLGGFFGLWPTVALVIGTGVLGAALACADLADRARARLRPLAPLALVLLAAPALLLRVAERSSVELEERDALRAGLAWMRAAVPSAGPWNHPDARPDWWVLTAPGHGASVAQGARRPVFAAAPPGLRNDGLCAERAARLLAGPPDTAQAEALRVLGVRYLVVSSAMASDAWLQPALREAEGETLYERATRSSGDFAGFERLWPQAAAPARASIWLVAPRPGDERPASLRSR